MSIKLTPLMLLAALFFFTNLSLQAQMVRVNNVEAGPQCYIEVFEYDYVSQKPEFPGGNDKVLDYINDNREYPAEAYNKGIQGRVKCSFIVNTDGSISNVCVLTGVHALLDEEAVRILNSMPRWKPGRHDGKAVPVRVIQTVKFRR